MYTREDVNENTIVLTMTIPREAFDKSYKAILKDQTKDSKVKGFRKGKVPSELLEPSMKPMLQFKTFEKLAPMYINTAIQKEKIELIAPPKYSKLPKFDTKDDLEFKVEVTIMPEFKLGNMKKVKIEKKEVSIEKKDVDQAIQEIKTNNKTKVKKIGDSWAKEIAKKLKLKDITNLEELKKEIKNILTKQKEQMLRHTYQENALKQAINLSDIKIPQPAIEFEAKEREKAFEQEMQQRGIKVNDFVKQSNLKMEQMREAWLKDAKDALESDAFLTLYANKRNIKVEKEEIDKKIEIIKKSRPNVDQSIFSNDQWLEYIKKVERKEKAFKEFIKETLGKEF
ncbi:TPA: hypothetical protein DEP90_00820 [Patescibacteria group bacterium]|nr:hypothetical protein [Patescibacteria group bacterium]